MRRFDGLRSLGLLCRSAAVAAAATAVGWTAVQGLREPAAALAFGLLMVLGEAVRTELPGGRDVAPLGAAAAFGYALLGETGGSPAAPGAAQVVAVCAAALLLGAVPAVLAGAAPSVEHACRRLLTVGFAAVCFQPLHGSGLVGPGQAVPAMLVVLLATGLFGAVLGAGLDTPGSGLPYGVLLREELRGRRGLGAAVCATAAVMASAVAVAGLWALPVFCVPLLPTQLALRRYAASQAVYRQTIASLARATEVAGHTVAGHSHRVAALSREVGRRLGLRESELLVLEYAALMHDIGQLSLLDPVPGGATEPLDPRVRRRIAALGGAVVRQSGVPEEVALIVEQQAGRYRDQPVAARVVRAVNAYEELAGGSGGRADPVGGPLGALERLRLATAHELDPRVVEALACAVSRGAVR